MLGVTTITSSFFLRVTAGIAEKLANQRGDPQNRPFIDSL